MHRLMLAPAWLEHGSVVPKALHYLRFEEADPETLADFVTPWGIIEAHRVGRFAGIWLYQIAQGHA